MPTLTLDQLLSPSHLAMYLADKPRHLDFYKDSSPHDMMIEISPAAAAAAAASSSGSEEISTKAPKKRAETWAQEEARALIGLRREMDGLFNTSKSNKHLWDQISAKMREKGFDRSPMMCTDKWRNLLKEFKKAKHQHKGTGPAKMSYYKELDELLKERSKSGTSKAAAAVGAGAGMKVDAYLQFPDKGMEDPVMPYGCVEGGDNHTSYGGRVIIIKWGEYTKRIGIDGTAEAIKEAIKSAFGLRTKRAFWLEDEDEVVRSLDRDMPLGTYTLHLDDGVTIKVCVCEDAERLTLRTEDKTLYTEEDFRDFLARRGWSGLREFSGFRTVDGLDDLRSGGMYQGIRLLVD